MEIRKYKSEDCAAMADLFYETVHTVNARDYTPAQRKLYEIYSADQDKIPDLVKAYQWLYLAMTFMFPDSENILENAPELAELEKRLSVDQKQQAMDFVENFIKERRPYALSK